MADGALVADKFGEISRFARVLESSELRPRAMVYAIHTDTEDERLLLVPAEKRFDEREVYRQLSILLSGCREAFPSIDVSDFRIVSDNEPYIQALATLFKVDQFSTITIDKSVLNGIYIERAVVFRLSL